MYKKMKKIALIAMMLMPSGLCIQAQEKLCTPGKTWIYHNENTLMPCNDYYYKVSVAGDTVVNGVNATILCRERLDDDHAMWKFVQYEDNGLIYSLDEDGKVWPLMDFSLHSGDVFYLIDPSKAYAGNDDVSGSAMRISDEQTYCIEGIDRRVLTIKHRDNNDAGEDYWIEGIGAPNPLGYITIQEFTTDGSVRYLSECYDGDRLIFSKANFDKLVTGMDEVPSDKRQCEAVYDLMGRRVANPVKGHLYITASKKRVW